MKTVLLWTIRGYRVLISPLLPPVCRFTPTCSRYAITAIERFGVWRGTVLAMKRIGRCHPFHPGGYDPVPEGLWQIGLPPLDQVITHAAASEVAKSDTNQGS